MTNHVHLLLTPEQHDSAALLMKHLGQRYVQYINRGYRRSGTLWEGRFRSCLVQERNYVLACYRYIEMNPVRAGMVTHPAEYLALGETEVARLVNYRHLFDTGIDPNLIAEIRTATNGNYALGTERFSAEVSRMLQRRVTPGKAGRPAKP
jgi:putative transposase